MNATHHCHFKWHVFQGTKQPEETDNPFYLYSSATRSNIGRRVKGALWGDHLHVSFSSSRPLSCLGQLCYPSGIILSRLRWVSFGTRNERVPFFHTAWQNRQPGLLNRKDCPIEFLRPLTCVIYHAWHPSDRRDSI